MIMHESEVIGQSQLLEKFKSVQQTFSLSDHLSHLKFSSNIPGDLPRFIIGWPENVWFAVTRGKEIKT